MDLGDSFEVCVTIGSVRVAARSTIRQGESPAQAYARASVAARIAAESELEIVEKGGLG